MVETSLTAEVDLQAKPGDYVLEGADLCVLQGDELVHEEGVGEVVVDRGGEADVQESRAEQGVGGPDRLEVVDSLHLLVGVAGTGKSMDVPCAKPECSRESKMS